MTSGAIAVVSGSVAVGVAALAGGAALAWMSVVVADRLVGPWILDKDARIRAVATPVAPRSGVGLGSLVIHRIPRGRTDRLREYIVLVDGVARGGVREGETTRVVLPAGEHRVQMKIDWASSRTVSVEVRDGHETQLKCRPNTNSLTSLWVALLRPRRYVQLQFVDMRPAATISGEGPLIGAN